MHGFDLEQLRSFVTAVEAGSLTAAAPLRFLSQSSLSEQLRKLEARAGQTLLVRSKTGVTPTTAGQRLMVHARQILALSEAAWRDMQETPLAGEIRLAVTEYYRPADLAALLARVHQQHPQIRLNVHIDKSDAIHAAYTRGAFDLAVTMQIAGQGRSATTGPTLRREPLHWAGASGLLRSTHAPLRLVALPETCSLRRLAVERLEKRKTPYVVAHVASGVAGIQSAVSAGLGIACLNASALGGDVISLPRHWGLPALPQVVFKITAARAGEQPLVAEMRSILRTVLQR